MPVSSTGASTASTRSTVSRWISSAGGPSHHHSTGTANFRATLPARRTVRMSPSMITAAPGSSSPTASRTDSSGASVRETVPLDSDTGPVRSRSTGTRVAHHDDAVEVIGELPDVTG